MPYVKLNTVLKQDLSPNDKMELKYPEGVTQGSFFGASDHTLGIESRFFRAPKDFIVIPTQENIVVQWTSNLKVPAGALMHFQFQEQGGDYYTDNRTGVTVKGMVQSPTFLVNLGSVTEKDQNFYVQSAEVPSAGRMLLSNNKPDVARNLIIHSTADESAAIFTIEGEDVYLRPMIEQIKGPSTGIINGKKAFAKINKISISTASKGSVSIGTGNRLGLPVFIPGQGYILQEMINGMPINGGMVVSGELNVPTATTGDRRGTYSPPPSVQLNGRDTIQLFLILPNPGNIGTPDFAG
jgi:hypothetical protein